MDVVGCGSGGFRFRWEPRNLLTEGNGDHEEDRGGGEGEGVCLGAWRRYIVTTLVNIGDY